MNSFYRMIVGRSRIHTLWSKKKKTSIALPMRYCFCLPFALFSPQCAHEVKQENIQRSKYKYLNARNKRYKPDDIVKPKLMPPERKRQVLFTEFYVCLCRFQSKFWVHRKLCGSAGANTHKTIGIFANFFLYIEHMLKTKKKKKTSNKTQNRKRP